MTLKKTKVRYRHNIGQKHNNNFVSNWYRIADKRYMHGRLIKEQNSWHDQAHLPYNSKKGKNPRPIKNEREVLLKRIFPRLFTLTNLQV